MMVSTELEDYLALENSSRYKHEYLEGCIHANQGEPARGMAGDSAAHADLIRNTGFALHGQLRGTGCSVKMTEMRLRIEAASAVFYPDVLVHCSPVSDPASTMELTEARLVVEVLSPSTQAFDRGPKLQAYQQLAGLQHILLLSSTEEAAWYCSRVVAGGPWGELAIWPVGSTLALPGLNVHLGWNDIYAGVGLS